MASFLKRISYGQMAEIVDMIQDEDEFYAHSGDSYDAGMIYGIELALTTLGFSVNRDEDGNLQDVSW